MNRQEVEQEMKTHFKKAFDSPYLSSADITETTILTISHVKLEANKAGRKDEKHNTAYFVEKEIRPGEALKPMVLNVTNCKTMKKLTGTAFIDDWQNVPVSIYVDPSVKFGRDMVEGLRISTKPPVIAEPASKEQLATIQEYADTDGSPMKPETREWLQTHTPNKKQATALIESLKESENVA